MFPLFPYCHKIHMATALKFSLLTTPVVYFLPGNLVHRALVQMSVTWGEIF